MDRFVSRRPLSFAIVFSILVAGLSGPAHARPSGGRGLAVGRRGITFPDKVFGVSGEKSWPKRLKLRVSKKSGSDARIKSVSIDGANSADFALRQGENCAGAKGCVVTVTFTPTGLGERTATLTVTNSSGANPRHVALSGRGIRGGIKWQPREITFGKVRPGGSSAPEAVSITNPNAAPISITGISLSSKDFTATKTQACVGNLAPHSSCQFFVAANPPAVKSRKKSISAKLEIQDDASGNPHRVDLSAVLHGKLVSPPPPPPPGALTREIVVTNTPCNNVTAYGLGAIGNAAPLFTQPLLCTPRGIALDANHNVYVTNSGDDGNPNNTVAVYSAASIAEGNLQIAPSSVIGGALTGLGGPRGIALDSSGNIYVANQDTGFNDVDAVTIYSAGSTGNVAPTATITGSSTGLAGAEGIAVDTTHGKIYVANIANNTVTVYPTGLTGTVNEAPIATIRGFNTGLANPVGVAVDSIGNIYVVNSGNGFSAGSGGSGGSSPGASVTIYPAGSTGNVTPTATISGATTTLGSPVGIALDSSNNVYVVDGGQVLVFAAVGASTGIIDVAPVTTLALVANSVALAIDTSAVVSAGTTQPIYTGDDGAATGQSDTVSIYPSEPAGSVTGIPTAIINGQFLGTNNGMNQPVGIVLGHGKSFIGSGSVVINQLLVTNQRGSGSGSTSRSVQVYAASSGAVGAPGTIQGGFSPTNSVTGIALDSLQDVYLVANRGSEVDIFSSFDFGFLPIGVLKGDTTLISGASGIALDANDNIYLTNDATDILGDRVTVYPAGSTGNQAPSAVIVGPNTGLAFPAGMTIDSLGNIYVANKATDAVTVYSPTGLSGQVNATPSQTISGANTLLNTPSAVALDSNNLIYVTNEGGFEGGNVSVTVYAAGATGNATPVTTIVGPSTQLSRPQGIAIIPPPT